MPTALTFRSSPRLSLSSLSTYKWSTTGNVYYKAHIYDYKPGAAHARTLPAMKSTRKWWPPHRYYTWIPHSPNQPRTPTNTQLYAPLKSAAAHRCSYCWMLPSSFVAVHHWCCPSLLQLILIVELFRILGVTWFCEQKFKTLQQYLGQHDNFWHDPSWQELKIETNDDNLEEN